MADLRELLTNLGCREVQTVLQTGNLVFRSRQTSTATLEEVLATEATRRLGLATDFMVRTATQWRAVVAGNPYPAQATHDPGHLLVMFLKSAPGSEEVAALQAAVPGREHVHVEGKHAWITYPDGIGRSRLTGELIERKLGTRGTGRNWNTVLRLEALATALE